MPQIVQDKIRELELRRLGESGLSPSAPLQPELRDNRPVKPGRTIQASVGSIGAEVRETFREDGRTRGRDLPVSQEFAENARDSVVGAAVPVSPRIKLDIFRSGFDILATPPRKNVTLEEAARQREAKTRAAGVHPP